jgi:serine/threonine protein kinase
MVFDVLGTSLFDFMEENNFQPFPIEEVQHLAVQLVVALEYMHSMRLTHTDIKPENVMFDSARTLKVRGIVFGLQQLLKFKHGGVTTTTTTTTITTIPPLSPENANSSSILGPNSVAAERGAAVLLACCRSFLLPHHRARSTAAG